MTAPSTQEKAEQKAPVIGLALSGGGFRAAAFHLGVLRRLRELGVLGQIRVLSTVSGGSIVGALWVGAQALGSDTLADDGEWAKFEHVLIHLMSSRPGLRQIIFVVGFVLPLLVLSAVAAPFVWWPWPMGARPALALLAGAFALSYLFWHFQSSALLEMCYDRLLYRQARLCDLDPARAPRRCPYLVINATGLNNGEIVLFPTQDHPPSGADYRHLILSKVATRYFLEKDRPNLPMPASTPIARAVAASSAIPGLFAPLKLTGALDQTPWSLRGMIWGESGRADSFRAVDGGVTDNQGAFLIGSLCEHLIVSDGSASLKEHVHPSTWQLWPPGKGVFFRAQDIIFERVRELGYRRLRDWQGLRRELHKALRNCGLGAETIDAVVQGRGMSLLSYSYVELEPAPNFPWAGGKQRLPAELIPSVSTIRTDLDTFSLVEISALMFHGYTLIDHCLNTVQPGLLAEAAPPLKFSFPTGGAFRDWDNPIPQEIERARKHLSVSGSRLGTWRRVYRLLKRC
jgi:predicted acylesterase/phospholipase RssA